MPHLVDHDVAGVGTLVSGVGVHPLHGRRGRGLGEGGHIRSWGESCHNLVIVVINR